MPEGRNGSASRPESDRPAPAKRFYERAASEFREGAHQLLLDGRPARTPARKPLAVPTTGLAEALAAEWNGQGEFIDPASMLVTRLANTAIDGVAAEIEAVRSDLARYAGSDLVCYRAGEPDGLVAAQAEAWDPVLAWARDALGARFVMSVGVTYVQQPEPALDRVRAALAGETSPFRLAPLHVMTTLTGSVLLALMLRAGATDVEAAWRAAHADELHQERLWGEDYEAAVRREARRAEFETAARFLALARET